MYLINYDTCSWVNLQQSLILRWDQYWLKWCWLYLGQKLLTRLLRIWMSLTDHLSCWHLPKWHLRVINGIWLLSLLEIRTQWDVCMCRMNGPWIFRRVMSRLSVMKLKGFVGLIEGIWMRISRKIIMNCIFIRDACGYLV